MAYVIINEKHLKAIADVLRAKDGRDTYKPREMAPAIERLDLLNCAGILGRYFKGGEVPGETFEVIVGECCVNEDGTYFVPENMYYGKTIKGEVVIPFGVIELSDGVFKDTKGITNVVFPYGFTTINKEAFRNALDMTSITLGPDVQVIGEYAFADNEKLLIIELNDNLTIGDYSFAQIPNLQQIVGTIPNVPNYAFAGCASLSDITLSDDIETIGSYAFSGCESLTGDFICPSNLTSIGDYAFQSCGLNSITLNDNLNTIGAHAFSDSELSNVTFGKNLTKIDSYAFANALNLNSITLPDSVVSINAGAFACDNDFLASTDDPGNRLSSITFSPNTMVIDDYAFKNCNLLEVTIPPLVTKLNHSVFLNNKNLKKVNLNDKITLIDTSCFGGTDITHFSCPASLTNFHCGAFTTPNYGGSNLKNLEFNLSPDHPIVFHNTDSWYRPLKMATPTESNKNYITFKGQGGQIPKVYSQSSYSSPYMFSDSSVNNANTVISVPWSQSENPYQFPWGATKATIIYNNGL